MLTLDESMSKITYHHIFCKNIMALSQEGISSSVKRLFQPIISQVFSCG